MRLRKFLVASLVSVLSFSSLSAASAANPKAGNSCSSIGKKQVHAGKTFTCVKSGKKLVWSKGVSLSIPKTTPSPSPTSSTDLPVTTPSPSPSPTPTNSPTPTPTPMPTFTDPREQALTYEVSSTAQMADVEICKLKTNSNSFTNEGFPRRDYFIPSIGNHRGLVIFVDFPDLISTGDEMRVWRTQQIPTFKKFIESMSYGQLNYEFDLTSKIYRINKSVLAYNLDTPHGAPMKPDADATALVRDAVNAADPDFDFSKYSFINVVTPSTTKIGFEGVLGTSLTIDGKSFRMFTFGPIREYADDPAKYPWLVHEAGHAFGLLHPYMNPNTQNVNYGLPAWDLMGNAITFAPEYMAWNRFLLGWLGPNRVNCLNALQPQKTTHFISPISTNTEDVKAVIVKLTNREAMVIENRRSSAFDLIERSEEGIYAYVVDVDELDNRGAVKPLYVRQTVRRGMLLGTLIPGEKVSYKGVEVEVLSSAIKGDYVSVDTRSSQLLKTPTSFDNLFENRFGISLGAWQKSSDIIKSTKAKYGTLDVYTGPNSKPYFDDYPTAVSLVSRLFPGRAEPTKTVVIRFKYVDLEWADATFKEKFGDAQYQQMNTTENGRLVPSQCNTSTKNCTNSMQQTSNQGTSLILQGIQNTDDPNDATGKMRFYSGMLEAHEYFHALQRIPIMGKSNIWPHAWFREGGAEWVQNVAINYQDFKTYADYLRLDCAYECPKLSESDIVEFLQTAKENYLPPKFPQWLNYSLGAYVIEALVSVKGPDSLIEMYAQMGNQLSFAQAFKNTYGVEWSYAIPILAKTIHANLNGK